MTTPAVDDADAAGMESSIAEVERQFGRTLAAARRTVKESACAVHPSLQPLGFTVMMNLYHGGESPQGTVVDTMQVDKALLSRTVSQLETLGLVVRRPDPADGRVQLLDLSAEGRSKFETSNSAKRARIRDRLMEWSPSELQHLAELLRKLNDVL